MRTRSRRTRAGLAAAALLALGAAGCGHQVARTHVRQVVPAPAPATPRPRPTWTPYAVPPGGSLVAIAHGRVFPVYRDPRPGPVAWSLPNPNSLGASLVLLVHGQRPGWLQVDVPVRPNGSTGWVRRSSVTLRTDPYRVLVSESAHRLTLLRNGRPWRSYVVGVGSPASPTPTGSFYLTELLVLAGDGGPYGPYAYGTSAFSNVYTEFEGGPGQIGLHGTDAPWSVGASVSHGCIRMNNADVAALAKVLPVGTPIVITA